MVSLGAALRAPSTSSLAQPFACLILFAALSANCGGSPAPAPSTPPPAGDPEAPAEAAPAATDTDVAPSDNPAPVDTPASTAPSGASAAPAPADLCQKMCDRVGERCTPENTEACRGNCREWDSPPPGCEAEVREALECARTAEDIQCVNIMPSSCTRKFKKIEACAAGKQLEGKEMSLDMPATWQRFAAKEAGFSIPMPPGVESKESAGEKSYTAKVGSVSYSVRVLAAPDPKIKDLQVAQNVLGDCMKKLQLKGLIERPERRSLEFKAGCSAGREASGLLVTIGSKLYVVSVIGPTVTTPERDVFVYGFKAPL